MGDTSVSYRNGFSLFLTNPLSRTQVGIGREGGIPFPGVPKAEGGWHFQFMEEESDALTRRRVTMIPQAEQILRSEFNFLP